MTPNCLRRIAEPYAVRVAGYQGYHAFPHSVMGVGVKAPAPSDVAARPGNWSRPITPGSRGPRKPAGRGENPPGLGQLYRSKGERLQIANYYSADFTIDVDRPASAQAG